jgi:hypothetical protein
MSWEYFPNSPFGDVDICNHGCTRQVLDRDKKICISCDYPSNANIMCLPCLNCNPTGGTWHLDGNCLICGTYTDSTKSFL